MICVKALVSQVEQGEHARALSRVLGNGRTSERRLQAWLRQHPKELPVVAMGFALTRLAELTYGPTDEGSRLAERLLNQQQLGGGFGESHGNRATGCGFNPVSTAVALCGLLFHVDQYRQLGLEPDSRLAEGADRAARVLVDWIIEQRAADGSSEELAMVRSQLEATMVLGISANDMLHEVGVGEPGTCELGTAQSAAA